MSWRFDPTAALSTLEAPPANLANLAKAGRREGTTLANLANLATSTFRLNPAPAAVPAGGPIPPLGPSECAEVHGWPPETQRVRVKCMAYFEGKGYTLGEAERLGYATVKALWERHGGPVGFKSGTVNPRRASSQALPAEVVPLVEMVKSVFGPGLKVKWKA